MSEQGAIAAGDHGARIPQQGFDGVTGGSVLPFLAIESGDVEHDLRDLPLRRAIAVAIKALQHPAQPQALLPRQPCIRWNRPAVKGGQQAVKGFEPVEPVPIEGNDGGKRLADHRVRFDHELDALAVAEIVEKDVFAIVRDAIGGLEPWRQHGVRSQACGRWP